MTFHVPGLSCYPGKQSLDARCWPKFRCTQACGALVTTSTATTALGGLSEGCALQGNTELGGNGAPQKPEMKDKCKDCLSPAITILLLMCFALFSL